MTRLKERIAAAIRANGPMPVSLYMLMCLHDPQFGYYATRPRFNRDFTTAPETSQVFGELLGLWSIDAWRSMGAPPVLEIIELGPGRAIMMADILRVARTTPEFARAVRINFVEASPLLRDEQRARLADWPVRWIEDLRDAPAGPTIVLGNEYLDCMNIHQAVRTEDVWRARQVGLAPDERLQFGLGPPIALPDDVKPSGDQVEWAPALEALVVALAERFAANDGRALLVDYGSVSGAPNDTLRAYRDGRQVSPLETPGECDLTADVDFSRLGRLAADAGLSSFGPSEQGAFLTRLGVRERFGALVAANPDRAQELKAALDRLVSRDQMGKRFKAICLAPVGSPVPAGFE